MDSAKIPSRLEPNGIFRDDGRRSDGATLTPWKRGRILVWDFTCTDTFAPSHITLAACGVGNVANEAEHHKKIKYSHLDNSYMFIPIAVETSGVLGLEASSFLKELGRRIALTSGEAKSGFFLLQRVSMELQRGNAAAVLGTLG